MNVKSFCRLFLLFFFFTFDLPFLTFNKKNACLSVMLILNISLKLNSEERIPGWLLWRTDGQIDEWRTLLECWCDNLIIKLIAEVAYRCSDEYMNTGLHCNLHLLLFSIVLYCTVLYGIVLYCIVFYCMVLYCTMIHLRYSNVLHSSLIL